MNKGMIKVRRGMLIASAAASLILAGNVVARAADKAGGEVHCAGINACKGKGVVAMSSADECKKAGGQVVAEK